MVRRRSPPPDAAVDIDAVLAALDADALRELVRELLLEADERLHGRILDRLIERAARSGAGWAPPGPPAGTVSSIVSFANAAERTGYADPRQVDEYLREGISAFLRRDYVAAFDVFRCLLIPIGEGEIDLGQDELVEEVLSVDPAACAAMHVVAAYMSAEPTHRADTVSSAIDDVRGFGHFWASLREMEGVALEPLPGFEDFLARWRILLEEKDRTSSDGWDRGEVRWLREVIERSEGTHGLEELARSSRRADDLRAWCRALTAANDWKAALAAYDEAADIAADEEYARAEFLDGAALAAQALGRRDLPSRVERAWVALPTMLRLRRWLGSAKTAATIRKRAAQALKACPARYVRQSGLLHVVLGHPDEAAKSLARAPGLGWSAAEHPGHLLFPLFRRLLGAPSSSLTRDLESSALSDWDDEELEWPLDDQDQPRLDAPGLEEILNLAGAACISDEETRKIVLRAMQKAAEKRVAGVTGKQRRNHYGHAALLVASCTALDASPQMERWVAGIRERFRRYPAFRRELAHRLGQ